MEILIQPINLESQEFDGNGCNVDIGCVDVDVCVPDN